ncbi:MAG: phytanoyl-CoA dioxygenase family protein [Opitutaceae bacterium]|nr:phytanoyl-CoA dioxygenase family protein [Cephaloticoccus sp.]MCP5530814.1 phytanoyl-CoA dioxygenase family protein [Opitutaceae bacterium]
MPSPSAPQPLSEQQIAFFQTFGFLAFPGLLKDRIDEIIREFTTIFQKRGGGHDGRPHDGRKRSCIVPFLDQSAVLCTLLDDPRISGIASSLLGDDFNYMPSDGNYYSGDTGWHSDGWHRETMHIKIAFYLDPLTRDTGCLRVIPGSHRIGDKFADDLHEQLNKSAKFWGMEGKDVPAIALETQPGDILVFNHNTKHAAFGGNGWRRMFTMNLCQRYPEARVQELRDYLNGVSRFWVERAYGEIMMNTAGPDRLRHLEQVMANDGHIAELSRQARESMAEPSRG